MPAKCQRGERGDKGERGEPGVFVNTGRARSDAVEYLGSRILTTSPFGPTDLEVHLTAAVDGPMARPDHTTVPPQSVVHVRDVANTI